MSLEQFGKVLSGSRNYLEEGLELLKDRSDSVYLSSKENPDLIRDLCERFFDIDEPTIRLIAIAHLAAIPMAVIWWYFRDRKDEQIPGYDWM